MLTCPAAALCTVVKKMLKQPRPAAMCALLGKIPTKAEYMENIKVVNAKAADIYRYMNFDQIPAFVEVAETVEM